MKAAQCPLGFPGGGGIAQRNKNLVWYKFVLRKFFGIFTIFSPPANLVHFAHFDFAIFFLLGREILRLNRNSNKFHRHTGNACFLPHPGCFFLKSSSGLICFRVQIFYSNAVFVSVFKCEATRHPDCHLDTKTVALTAQPRKALRFSDKTRGGPAPKCERASPSSSSPVSRRPACPAPPPCPTCHAT